jgi:hypothetical protein
LEGVFMVFKANTEQESECSPCESWLACDRGVSANRFIN